MHIVIEQEPGGSGKTVTNLYHSHILRGYITRSDRPTGPKETRAHPVAAAAENGLLRVVRSTQTRPFLDELTAFPHTRHDDCVDALSGAHTYLATRSGGPMTILEPTGQIPTSPALHARDQTVIHRGDPLETIAAMTGAHIWPSRPR